MRLIHVFVCEHMFNMCQNKQNVLQIYIKMYKQWSPAVFVPIISPSPLIAAKLSRLSDTPSPLC